MEANIYPTSIFCIIATEFCERFSFCGLRTILSLYLRNVLLYPEGLATVAYHVFIMLCYLVPLAGALLADGFLGRYKTILYFSIVYLIGNILMCLAATPPVSLPPGPTTSLGLLLIAAGTGGIKPCVAAFGGDQFLLPEQENQLATFFSLFYFTINLGGLVGMLLTPILRKRVTCFGDDTCYSLGFGFPAALMMVALCVFVLGRNYYRMKTPRQSVIFQFFSCVWYAAWHKFKHSDDDEYRHWLDRSANKYSNSLINDAKSLLKVLTLYLPLPMFWTLFDQQGSRWIFQAARMDGDFAGLEMLPDQTQVANPLIALLLIPVFEKGIYPLFPKLPANPLLRMALGGLAAGGAFLASGALEIRLEVIQETYPVLPTSGEAAVHVINTLPCESEVLGMGPMLILESSEMKLVKNVPADPWTEYEVRVFAPLLCGSIELDKPQSKLKVNISEGQIPSVLIGLNEDDNLAAYLTEPQDVGRTLTGKPKIRVALIITSHNLQNVSVNLEQVGIIIDEYIAPENQSGLALSAYMELPPGDYNYSVHFRSASNPPAPNLLATIDASKILNTSHYQVVKLRNGGVYSLVMRERKGELDFAHLFTLTDPNSIHMIWLLPQYILISIAEVMFAVSGLEFSFTQAPKSLKTITIAAWYLSVATGNLLVICITQANIFERQAHEFFLFALMMVIDMAVFWRMARGYRLNNVEADGSSCSLLPVQPES